MSTGNNDPIRCDHCGGFHAAKCPLVKAYEYHPDGTLRRVEFYAPNDHGPLVSAKTEFPYPFGNRP